MTSAVSEAIRNVSAPRRAKGAAARSRWANASVDAMLAPSTASSLNGSRPKNHGKSGASPACQSPGSSVVSRSIWPGRNNGKSDCTGASTPDTRHGPSGNSESAAMIRT
jgi:hypothetical protein